MTGSRLRAARHACEDIAVTDVNGGSRWYESLAGVHKVAMPIIEGVARLSDAREKVTQALRTMDDGFNFCVSLYGYGSDWEEKHEEASSQMLSIVREGGFRKANLIRPRGSPELRSDEVLSRRALDFVVFPAVGQSLGLTVYVPETAGLKRRSQQRPVVSSQISLSPRLAKLLVNLAGVNRGGTILDPFCGSGTILGEAMLLGVDCVGVDKNPGRVENTRRNLSWLSSNFKGTASYSIAVGDSIRLNGPAMAKVDAVVTEPILLPRMTSTPRMEKAKRLIRNASRLYSEALYAISDAVRKGGRVVIVVPSLRTVEGRYVSVALEDVEEAGLRKFQPGVESFEYPIRISHENTRWIRRLVYVLERF